MPWRLLAGAILVLLPAAVSFAQDFSGAYVLEAQGVTLTLMLKQDAQGNITGRLSSTTGAQFEVQGLVQQGVGIGMCVSNQGGSYFEAHPQGDKLLFALIEPGPDRRPDYNRVRKLVFARQPAGPPSGQPGPGPQGPFGGAVRPPLAPPSPGGTGPGISAELSVEEVGDPNWGFKFRPPSGWKYQKGPNGAVLGHDTIPGMILVFPHMASNFQEMLRQMQEGLQEDGTRLSPAGQLVRISDTAVAGEYMGIQQGQQVKARGIGTLSPHGGGAYILALTTPQQFSPQLANAADLIARSMQYSTAQVSHLVPNFAGTWVTMTRSTQTSVVLAPDGTYAMRYESSYSGQFHSSAGVQTGAWGTARDDVERGRWTVRGTREQGVIVLTSQEGKTTTLEYRVHVERGQVFWREYFFNGELYQKQQ